MVFGCTGNSKYSMINMNLMGKEMEGNQGRTMSKRDQGVDPWGSVQVTWLESVVKLGKVFLLLIQCSALRLEKGISGGTVGGDLPICLFSQVLAWSCLVHVCMGRLGQFPICWGSSVSPWSSVLPVWPTYTFNSCHMDFVDHSRYAIELR